MFRAKIQELLENHRDPKEAAILVCILLEDLMDLEGNGWFDEDEELMARLEAHWDRQNAEVKARLDAWVDAQVRGE
ncbi:hypothetical protein [Rhizobium sp. MHM7A]|uniref:hypothetical protein n=1 Tax=Rhizobium sp. MHM7A TaxID=2583233 RepID=UPI001105D546|nr:hypothetical protein [Rhizobium sp. MHM7A]TLX15849.1 hypothetical protein FFR93_00610 [Rhizobium sp. MHM7A]